jgi:hypothetical protein
VLASSVRMIDMATVCRYCHDDEDDGAPPLDKYARTATIGPLAWSMPIFNGRTVRSACDHEAIRTRLSYIYAMSNAMVWRFVHCWWLETSSFALDGH